MKPHDDRFHKQIIVHFFIRFNLSKCYPNEQTIFKYYFPIFSSISSVRRYGRGWRRAGQVPRVVPEDLP